MTRRTIGLLVTFILGLLVAPLAAPAQPAGKVPPHRPFSLAAAGHPRPAATPYSCRELRTLGYVEGQNILIEWRCAELNAERTRQFAGTLVQLGVDAIVANGHMAALAAKPRRRRIPHRLYRRWRSGAPAGPEPRTAGRERHGGELPAGLGLLRDTPGTASWCRSRHHPRGPCCSLLRML